MIETRGEHNHEMSAGKSEARKVKAFKRSQREIYNDCRSCQCGFVSYKWLCHSVLPLNLRQTDPAAARTRKQLEVNMPPIPVARKFRDPRIFYPVWQWIKWSRANHFARRPKNAENSGEVNNFLVRLWNFQNYSKNVLSAIFNSS